MKCDQLCLSVQKQDYYSSVQKPMIRFVYELVKNVLELAEISSRKVVNFVMQNFSVSPATLYHFWRCHNILDKLFLP